MKHPRQISYTKDNPVYRCLAEKSKCSYVQNNTFIINTKIKVTNSM